MNSDTKPTFIGLLPTDLFQVIQAYLPHKDYRNLMNCNKAIFANIKYETIVYRINPAKYLESKGKESVELKVNEIFYYNLINDTVKDKSKQISVRITTKSLTQILPFVVGLQGIRELYLSDVEDLSDTFDFSLFNNIHTVTLWGFKGVKSISSGFENVKELRISCFEDLQSITNINTTKTLEAFHVYSCNKLNILNFPLNNIVRLKLYQVIPDINLQTITRSTLNDLGIELNESIESVLLNPVDFSSLQVLSLDCHFPDSFHNFSLFENISYLSLCSKSASSISISMTKFNGRRIYLSNFKVFDLIQTMSSEKESFVNLKELFITRCHDFLEVPSLPKLEDLCLTECNLVKQIPSLNKLKCLNIYGCYELTFISPDQPNLNTCWINATKIEDVSFAARCKQACLTSNNQVKDVSMLGRVQFLQISQCHGLTSSDGLSGDPVGRKPDRRSLLLSNLTYLHAFSLHHIRSLRLVGLPYPHSCEGIHHIEHLHIQNCMNLKSTSGLKHISRSLDVRDCPQFVSLVDVEGIPLIRLKGNSRLKDYSAVQDEWTDCGVMDRGVQLFALKSMKEEMKEPAWRTTIENLLRS